MLLGVVLALAAAGGCASKGDMEALQQASRVQDDRLKAMETSVGGEIQRLNGEIERLVEQLRKAEARARGLADKTDKLLGTVIRPGHTLNWTFERGYDFIIAGGDTRLLGASAQTQVSGFRDNPPKRPKRSNAPRRKRR